ncbi:MAG: hypothetical protein PVF51_10370, partial [Nitrospirota bacterium]
FTESEIVYELHTERVESDAEGCHGDLSHTVAGQRFFGAAGMTDAGSAQPWGDERRRAWSPRDTEPGA